MITNVTPAAGPTNVINSEQKQHVYFGVGSASQTSQTFTVDQQPFYLSAYNLGSDDVITVQQVYGQGSGTEVASFAPVNGAVTLSQSRTKARIDHPGRYQLLHSGSSALGTFTVAGGAAVMTCDPLGDLAEALYQIFTSLGGNITVVAPITLTGNGTTQNPYIIGFQAGTVVGSASIVVTGTGTTSDPYVVAVNTAAGSAPPNFVEVTSTLPVAITGDGTNATPYALSFNYAAASSNVGSAAGTDTYTVSLGSFFASLVVGGIYNIFFINANTGAATLNVNGLGAKAILRRGVAVTAGQIPANAVLSLVFDATSNAFHIIGAA